ncbi:MAG: alpha-amylase family glycosyl hydrolase [Nocardioides sp.]
MPSQTELITYADRLGGDLPGLREVLRGPLTGLFGGVHLLPFFTPYDGADAGFDPADHTQVDPRLGTWADVAALAEEVDLMVDVIVNHVSAESAQFQDWLARGDASPSAAMFLTFGRAFPDGATEPELMRLYRPRPGLPFTPYTLADGTKRLLWTTFTPQQIDLDVRQEVTRDYLRRVLDTLAAAGVRRVRLDAVGYAVKTPGLTSFMTEETFRFIEDVSDWCYERGLQVLVEVHSYYEHQVEIARQVDRVYDFALPPLVLHALTTGGGRALLRWLGSGRSTPSPCSTPTTASGSSTSVPMRSTSPARACSRPVRSTSWWRRSTRTAAACHGSRRGPRRERGPLPGQLHVLRRARPRRRAADTSPRGRSSSGRPASRRSTTSACSPAPTTSTSSSAPGSAAT